MARRKSREREELAFGSDSFLDVVANVVGILIMLIVIVGVRVKNAPALTPDSTPPEPVLREWTAHKERIETQNDRLRREHEEALAARDAELRRRERIVAAHAQRQKDALAERLAAIETQNTQVRQFESEAGALAAAIQALEAKLADKKKQEAATAALTEQELRVRQASLEQLEREQKLSAEEEAKLKTTIREQLAALNRQIDELSRVNLPTKSWTHYATPIARRIELEELHYRCLNGRVADTHLDDLIDAIRRNLAHRDPSSIRAERGTVGPIGGFSLSYLLTRSTGLLSEQMRNPFSSGIQFGAWQLTADSTELGETKEQALREGSKFLSSLVTRPAEAFAVTLWVYPDSFALAKALETRLHEDGYQVALRPMPMGASIAGSPFGSASEGQ